MGVAHPSGWHPQGRGNVGFTPRSGDPLKSGLAEFARSEEQAIESSLSSQCLFDSVYRHFRDFFDACLEKIVGGLCMEMVEATALVQEFYQRGVIDLVRMVRG